MYNTYSAPTLYRYATLDGFYSVFRPFVVYLLIIKTRKQITVKLLFVRIHISTTPYEDTEPT